VTHPTRRRRRRFSGVVLVAVAVAVAVGLAGAATAGAQGAGPAIEVVGIDLTEFPTVRLRVSLSPEVAAPGLTPEAFRITENGDPVDAQFTPLGDEVVSIMLTIDTSGSMGGPGIDQAKLAAVELLEVLPDNVPVSVISFGMTTQVVSPFTTDRGESREAIQGLVAEGGTVLYDSLVLSAQESRTTAAARRAVLLLTDGDDSDSTATLEDAVDALGSAIDDFYIVSLETEATNPEAIDELAEGAGGRVIAAQDPETLTATYIDLGQRIVNQYEAVFTSTTAAGVGRYEISVDGREGTGSLSLALPNRPTTDPQAAAQRALPGVLTSGVETHTLQQDWVLWLGVALVGIALLTALVFAVPSIAEASGGGAAAVRRRRDRKRSLRSDAVVVDEGGSGAERAFESMRDAATRVATRAVERTESTGRIDAALDRAGLIMRAGEYVAVVVAVAIGAAIAGYLFLGVVGGVIGLLVPILGSKAFLNFKASRRNKKFGDQLSDALMIMSGALRSGFGVGQAIDTVAEEMEDPVGSEFRRAVLETRLGRDIEDALGGIAHRVQNEDFEWVIDAMRINRQVGGDLANILDQVGETIRSRNRLKRQVAALTAEGRISAMVLGSLPIGMGLILYTSNPDYMAPLFSRTIGWIMLGIAVGLLVTGALWLKKMIDIEY
jgi:tight adherence protein B